MKKGIIYSIIVLVAASPLFRGLFFAFETNIFLTAVALLSVAYFLIKLSKTEEIHINKWLLLFGALFVLSYVIAFINAVNVRDNITTLLQTTEYFVLSIILFDYFHDKKQQFGWVVLLSVSLSGFFNAIIGIEAISGHFKPIEEAMDGQRLGGTFQYANTAAIYFVLCLIFSLSLISTSNKLLVRIILKGIGNVTLLAMLLTASRGGYLVGFVVLFIYILVQPSKHRLKAFGSLICISLPALTLVSHISEQRNTGEFFQLNKWLLLSFSMAIILGVLYELIKVLFSRIKAKAIWGFAAVAIILVSITIIIISKGFSAILPERILERFIRLARLGFNDYNVYIRLEFDKWALKLITDSWLLGRGGGAWESLYQSVQSIFTWARNTHNNYLQIFIESGIFGFISYLALIAISFYYAIYSLFTTKDKKNKILLTGLSCGFLALILHSSFDFDLTFVSLSLLFWVLIPGFAIYTNKEDEKISVRGFIASKNIILKYVMIIICSLLLSTSSLYSVSSAFAEKGYYKMDEGDFKAARSYYMKACELDGINPVYMFQLTKIYKYYADTSMDTGNSLEWRQIARLEAEKCVAENNYYPEYREILSRIYFDSGMTLEALNSVEKLITLQPLNNYNYGLLARAYYEAAEYYIKNSDVDKGKELFLLCSQINDLPGSKPDEAIANYKKKAIETLKKY